MTKEYNIIENEKVKSSQAQPLHGDLHHLRQPVSSRSDQLC